MTAGGAVVRGARTARLTQGVGAGAVGLSLPNAVREAGLHILHDGGLEAAYGWGKAAVAVVAVVALVQALRAPARAAGWLTAWAALVAALAGMAPVVFGGAPVFPTGALSLTGATLGLGAGLLWWRRVFYRAAGRA